MSNPTQSCNYLPYKNICCISKCGISVVQPKCQNLPDGDVVNNPTFLPSLNKSFWTYKFIIDCCPKTKIINSFCIPICNIIRNQNIIVHEKIDSCNKFISVPFTLTKKDPVFGNAPKGFQFLKVENKMNADNRYEKGLSVEYCLEILGNFPIGFQPIKVHAKDSLITFDCEGCFFVPKCNPEGKLTLHKKCNPEITNNQASLNYIIHINNIGNTPLDNVQFEDIIFIPDPLSIGTIVTNPSTLNIDSSSPKKIKISGNLGTIIPGQHLLVTYTIPITSITEPEKYIVKNTATVSSTGTKDSSICLTNLNVVKLKAEKSCKIEGSKATHILTISSIDASPDVLVDLYDHMHIPAGVTIKFTDLMDWEAYLIGTTNPVPINTNITGPISISFICKNAPIPSNGSYQKSISYILVSNSMVRTATITNTIIKVLPVNPSDQVFLGVLNIPVSTNIDVELIQVRSKPYS